MMLRKWKTMFIRLSIFIQQLSIVIRRLSIVIQRLRTHPQRPSIHVQPLTTLVSLAGVVVVT